MSPPVPISKKLMLVNATSSVATRVLSVTVLVWTLQFLLKRIAPEEYALLPVVMAVMLFVPLLTTFLTAGLSRYVTEAYAQGNNLRVTQVTSTMFPFLLVGGLLLGAVGTVLTWQVDSLLNIAPEQLADARIMMALLIASATIRLILAPFGVGLFVCQKFVWINLIALGSTVLRLLILLVLLLGVGPQVKWVVASQVGANLAALGLTTVLSCRLIPALRVQRDQVQRDIARRILQFNAWSFLGQLAGTIRQAADPLVLNKLATAVDVTSFHLGSVVDTQIRMMTITASQPLQPALTAIHATGQKHRLANAYLRGGRLSLWAVLLVAVPLAVYRNEILRLYLGDAYPIYPSAAWVMLLLLASFPLTYPRTMLTKIVHATAAVRPLMVRSLLAQSTNLFVTCLFVGYLKMGAIGSATATFLTALVFHPFVFWPLGLRLLEMSWSRFVNETLLPGLAPALAGVIVHEALRQSLQPASGTALSVCAAVGSAAYLATLWFCQTKSDRKDFARVLEKIKNLRFT